MSQKEFLAYARKCFELARTAATNEDRQTLVEMVEGWLRAAAAAHSGRTSKPAQPPSSPVGASVSLQPNSARASGSALDDRL
jgi:hypothetical protein